MSEQTPASTGYGEPLPPRKRAGGFVSAFSFVRFQFMAIILILVASGLVPYEDIVSVLLASLYIYTVATFVFPPVTSKAPPSVYAGNKLLNRYATAAGFVGVFCPLAFIMLGFVLGDKEAVKAAAPHTFLLACQVLSEELAATSNAISLPARALVPILYNSGRLVSIWEWIETAFGRRDGVGSTSSSSSSSTSPWATFGCILAIANMILWSYNLFGFLLPMYLRRCFRKYFEDEKVWKEKGKETMKGGGVDCIIGMLKVCRG